MRIWIDGQCLQTPSRTRGIGRYVTNFIRSLAQFPNAELTISFNAEMPYQAISARSVVEKWIDPRNIHIWSGVAKGGEVPFGYTDQRKLSELAISWHVESLQPDVALSASPFEGTWNCAVPLLPNTLFSRPIVSIFYDAIPHHFPDRYLNSKDELRAYNRRFSAYNRFTHNLCISEFSCNDAKRLFPNVPATNISTGVDPDLLNHLLGTANEKQFSRFDPFVLYVGALDWRKNVPLVIDAFALLPDKIQSQTKFVMVGEQPSELLGPLVEQWKANALPDGNLVALEHVDDSKLFELYRAARVLVQPSLMEGFGLTAVEAMLTGTPVLGSRGSALSEVIGDDDYQFDPSNAHDLANKIERFLTDEPSAQRASRQNLVRAKEFSWERTAGRALDTLLKIDVNPVPLSQDLQSSRDMYGEAASKFALEPIEIAKAFANSEVRKFTEERLFIDASSTLLHDHATGIQRVVKEICSSLSNRPNEIGDRNFIMFSDSKMTWQQAQSSEITKKISKRDALGSSNIYFRPSDHVLMLDSSWDLHETHLASLISLRLLGCDVATCLYDTIPLKHPAMCDKNMPPVFTEWLKSALLWSTGFVCISRAVADELFGILEAIEFPRRMKVGYWHLGANFSNGVKISASARRPAQNRSYLMVGTMEPRKGHTVAIDAFEKLWRDGGDEELVIVGKPGWNTKELSNRITNHAEYGRRLHWHRNVNDEKLAELYSNADALLATSFAEGFGLPIVEARHFGKPIVTSDIPVFREVTEGAACRFFEVGSADALANVLVEIRQGFGGNGHSSPSDWINWDQSAAQLRNVVMGDNWYKIYEPRNSNPFVALNDLGHISMSKPVSIDEREYQMEFVSGPTLDEVRGQLLLTVKVENQSQVVWSSRGPMALYVGCRLLNEQGVNLQKDNSLARIPFVHIPGDKLYIAVEVPTEWRERGATHVEVGIVQESVGWWDNTLHIPLT
ncbi:hypothetical protein CU102_23105 [Phyllobacterium brassicacearum]|uniref:Glycosyl transferase family 1 domain-containing protein n=1 Tax=Phyllobacterium brassicacearum TaxID=314235 RepID=A0A2P7BBA0_9HYPH|nr:glycosyltransferase family 1 protein [Phyllobacterium brassicacearum]PSH63751.1 hypothetical protein CU102_23105 [Phyllobacterium brassicacearum]TDQ31967.1 glycosyltransferase involved in cell wall biosynthesis [Phyllobacterium brassicacearum]